MDERPFTFENDWWFYFGYGNGWPAYKCTRCSELVDLHQRPNRHCVNCWKIEIFFSNCHDIMQVKEYFLKQAQLDHTLSGKWLQEPMQFTPEIKQYMTSIPDEGHPAPEITADGVILVYNQSIGERDERVKRFENDLTSLGLYKKERLSYRRGCLHFDAMIGPWKTWWPLDRDHEGQEEVVA